MYRVLFKPFLDRLFSFIVLISLSPILLLLIVVLFFSNNGKPFFIQIRPGKDGRLFKIVKLKTMNDRKDDEGILLPDKDRLTIIGNFVRKTSLDEIPQLLNVVKGDMSLIGPRPLLQQYLPLYNDFQKRRHEVKPGITGWAQVNGRNNLSWEKKFELDVWYVENLSFKIDLLIFLKTIKNTLFSEGINMDGNATTVAFNGSESTNVKNKS